ncbi:type II secretion system protein [bacterium]|nr:type II secretion system protein [bacterium]
MKIKQDADGGFTLLELLAVVTLILVISGLALSRFGVINSWQQKSDARRLVDTWQLLLSESSARQESYRIAFDLDRQSYRVLREVPLPPEEIQQVDLLQNLRLDSEKKRRNQKRILADKQSFSEELVAEEKRQAGDLEALFYAFRFRDQETGVRLTPPLEFPSLAEERVLPVGVKVKAVVTPHDEKMRGEAYIRISDQGTNEATVIYLTLNDQPYSIFLSPAKSKVELISGLRSPDGKKVIF